jgi:hypothetical protein
VCSSDLVATLAAPSVPPAPPTFSTMTVWFRRLRNELQATLRQFYKNPMATGEDLFCRASGSRARPICTAR